MPNPIIEFETQTGTPFNVDGRSIQVRSRALVLRFPFSTGGLVWNRPTSVSVRTADGREETLPVHDKTRLAELAIFGSTLLFSLLVGLALRKGS